MRFIICSKTAGTYLAPNFGGQYFSGYESSTFTNKATTWPSKQAANAYASEQFGDEDDPRDLEVLTVETGEDYATMEQCVAAGAAPWEHHLKKLESDPDVYNKPAAKLLLPALGDGGLVFGARAAAGNWFNLALLPLMVSGRKTFFFDADQSSRSILGNVNGKLLDVRTVTDDGHTLVLAPSARGKSILTGLTADERAALNEWSAAQPGDPKRGGAVDLMQWPGWEGVTARRFKQRFGVDMPKATS